MDGSQSVNGFHNSLGSQVQFGSIHIPYVQFEQEGFGSQLVFGVHVNNGSHIFSGSHIYDGLPCVIGFHSMICSHISKGFQTCIGLAYMAHISYLGFNYKIGS